MNKVAARGPIVKDNLRLKWGPTIGPGPCSDLLSAPRGRSTVLVLPEAYLKIYRRGQLAKRSLPFKSMYALGQHLDCVFLSATGGA
jgi:hypothetical protein